MEPLPLLVLPPRVLATTYVVEPPSVWFRRSAARKGLDSSIERTIILICRSAKPNARVGVHTNGKRSRSIFYLRQGEVGAELLLAEGVQLLLPTLAPDDVGVGVGFGI